MSEEFKYLDLKRGGFYELPSALETECVCPECKTNIKLITHPDDTKNIIKLINKYKKVKCPICGKIMPATEDDLDFEWFHSFDKIPVAGILVGTDGIKRLLLGEIGSYQHLIIEQNKTPNLFKEVDFYIAKYFKESGPLYINPKIIESVVYLFNCSGSISLLINGKSIFDSFKIGEENFKDLLELLRVNFLERKTPILFKGDPFKLSHYDYLDYEEFENKMREVCPDEFNSAKLIKELYELENSGARSTN